MLDGGGGEEPARTMGTEIEGNAAKDQYHWTLDNTENAETPRFLWLARVRFHRSSSYFHVLDGKRLARQIRAR